MNDENIRQILSKAKNIAILGLSSDESKPSNEVARYLIAKGFNIIPISPRGGEILGYKAFTSLQEAFSDKSLLGKIDILDIFRKSEALPQIANEILSLTHKPKCVWVQLGLHNMEAKNLLDNAGLPYIENHCIKLEHERLLG